MNFLIYDEQNIVEESTPLMNPVDDHRNGQYKTSRFMLVMLGVVSFFAIFTLRPVIHIEQTTPS
jgi:hypothetical protein